MTKRFGGVHALRGVSLRVRRGAVHAVVGENGAGKSTLMKILDGVYPAGSYGGQILLNGEAVEFHSPHDARLKGVGYVPQEIGVIESLSVAENIFVGSLAGGRGGGAGIVNFSKLYQRAEQFLAERGLPLDAHRPISSLSASQRQLVMIARALSADPSVLILDESTACLTGSESQALFRIVRGLSERGVTSLLITHKLDEVFDLADSATVLRDGSVAATFERAEFDRDAIVTAMIGRRLEHVFPPRESTAQEGEVLRVEKLTVPDPHRANRNVVEGVSFTLRRGEILGLAGLVGSGRSEILNAIYGRTPYAGTISVGGRPVRVRSPREAKRCGIALVTEDRKRDGLLLEFPIFQNMTLASLPAVSRFGLLSRRAERRASRGFMTSLSVRAPSEDVKAGNLSGGNQQKVVLAKALMAEPLVLLLDEPTKGVDVGAKQEIYRVISDLARRGIALVVVSSEMPELLSLCDRLLVLARGRVVLEVPKSEATEHHLMAAATGAAAPV